MNKKIKTRKPKKKPVKGMDDWDLYFEQRKILSLNWQKKKKDQGMCTQCGKNPINPNSKRRCSECLDKGVQASEKHRRKLGIRTSVRGTHCHRPKVPR